MNTLSYRTVEESDSEDMDTDNPGFRMEVDRIKSIDNVLAHLTKHLVKSRLKCQVTPVLQEIRNAVDGHTTVISLYTNYELMLAPEDAFVDAFGELLGEEYWPQWYLDDYEPTWIPILPPRKPSRKQPRKQPKTQPKSLRRRLGSSLGHRPGRSLRRRLGRSLRPDPDAASDQPRRSSGHLRTQPQTQPQTPFRTPPARRRVMTPRRGGWR
ncbi:hypothetical protein B0H21DRAFT_894405 [Amylocystis lapponica]|nr:hypothetical protein B0H21DRAFT_894405 [Amylocystis lapponica]